MGRWSRSRSSLTARILSTSLLTCTTPEHLTTSNSRPTSRSWIQTSRDDLRRRLWQPLYEILSRTGLQHAGKRRDGSGRDGDRFLQLRALQDSAIFVTRTRLLRGFHPKAGTVQINTELCRLDAVAHCLVVMSGSQPLPKGPEHVTKVSVHLGRVLTFVGPKRLYGHMC